MQPKVIDIYAGNSIEDWNDVKNAGILAVFHKASEGVSVTDRMYAQRRRTAADRFLWGAYHFNSRSSPIKDQVNHFLDVAQPDDKTALCLDWEGDSAAFTQSEARKFLELLMDATKRTPSGIWIYGGNVPRERITPDQYSFFGQFRNWHCQYGVTANGLRVSKAWTTWGLWQYSETGQLPGTGSLVDLNVYNGSDDALKAAWAPAFATGAVTRPSNPAPVQPRKPTVERPEHPAVSLGRKIWDWLKRN